MAGDGTPSRDGDLLRSSFPCGAAVAASAGPPSPVAAMDPFVVRAVMSRAPPCREIAWRVSATLLTAAAHQSLPLVWLSLRLRLYLLVLGGRRSTTANGRGCPGYVVAASGSHQCPLFIVILVGHDPSTTVAGAPCTGQLHTQLNSLVATSRAGSTTQSARQ